MMESASPLSNTTRVSSSASRLHKSQRDTQSVDRAGRHDPLLGLLLGGRDVLPLFGDVLPLWLVGNVRVDRWPALAEGHASSARRRALATNTFWSALTAGWHRSRLLGAVQRDCLSHGHCSEHSRWTTFARVWTSVGDRKRLRNKVPVRFHSFSMVGKQKKVRIVTFSWTRRRTFLSMISFELRIYFLLPKISIMHCAHPGVAVVHQEAAHHMAARRLRLMTRETAQIITAEHADTSNAWRSGPGWGAARGFPIATLFPLPHAAQRRPAALLSCIENGSSTMDGVEHCQGGVQVSLMRG